MKRSTRYFVFAALCLSSIAAAQSTDTGKRVTNAFTETELKQALSDVATQTGVIILADETVQGTVTASLKDVPLDQALNILLSSGNYAWIKADGYYLVGKAEPTSPNFLRFAVTKAYKPSNVPAEQIANLLPQAMSLYVKSAPGQNMLTITASPIMLERILQDVRALDTAAPRVMLEALVTEVSTETLNSYGLSWVWSKFGLNASDEASTFRYTSASRADVATIKALVGDGKATVRANPRIMTLEGKEALVEVAQENYFQVVTGPTNFPYTTLQQIKTGISLKMTPVVSENGEITVTLNPEVSDAAGNGKDGLPINTVRRANTTVRVKEGETIVIGGMTYASTRRRQNKIPLLGDIPLLGELFRFRNNETKNTEVIIMITPRIVR